MHISHSLWIHTHKHAKRENKVFFIIFHLCRSCFDFYLHFRFIRKVWLFRLLVYCYYGRFHWPNVTFRMNEFSPWNMNVNFEMNPNEFYDFDPLWHIKTGWKNFSYLVWTEDIIDHFLIVCHYLEASPCLCRGFF